MKSKAKAKYERYKPLPLSAFADMLDELRLCLSKIEKEAPHDEPFVRRLWVEKEAGQLRLTGTSANRIWLLHQRFVKQASAEAAAEPQGATQHA